MGTFTFLHIVESGTVHVYEYNNHQTIGPTLYVIRLVEVRSENDWDREDRFSLRLFIRRLLAGHDYGCFYTFNVVCLLDFMVRHKLIFGCSFSSDINNTLMCYTGTKNFLGKYLKTYTANYWTDRSLDGYELKTPTHQTRWEWEFIQVSVKNENPISDVRQYSIVIFRYQETVGNTLHAGQVSLNLEDQWLNKNIYPNIFM